MQFVGAGSQEGGGATAEERGQGGRGSDLEDHGRVCRRGRRQVDRFGRAHECRLEVMCLMTILYCE